MASCSACMARWSRKAMTIAKATCWRGCATSSGRMSSIAAELDPHSHLTPKRVAAADILASFLEFPHTDFYERGEHVVDLALTNPARRDQAGHLDLRLPDDRRAADQPRADAHPLSTASRRCMARTASFRSRSSTASWRRTCRRWARAFIVVTDNDKAAGDALAERARHGAVRHARAARSCRWSTPTKASTRRSPLRRANPVKPGVIADTWDNPGGGVAGDGTVISAPDDRARRRPKSAWRRSGIRSP